MILSCDLISHQFNNISLSPHPLTTLSLPTSQYTKPHPSIAKHCIDKKRARSYYQPLSSAVISLQFQSLPTSVVESQPFHIRNPTRIGLPYKALQLKKAHKTELA